MNKTIFFLDDYNWRQGELISEGPKRYKIRTPANGMFKEWTQYVAKEKCAFPDEIVCVVWETWRGVNGRGGYRVEREAYPEHRMPAQGICYASWGNGRVQEDSPNKEQK